MTVILDIRNQIYEKQQMSSSDKNIIEKSQRTAIEAIILYLKSVDNTVCLKRTYSIREAFENLDLITECQDYQSSMQLPNKKSKKSLEKPIRLCIK